MGHIRNLELSPAEKLFASRLGGEGAAGSVRDFVLGYHHLKSPRERGLLFDSMMDKLTDLSEDGKEAVELIKRARDSLPETGFDAERELLDRMGSKRLPLSPPSG